MTVSLRDQFDNLVPESGESVTLSVSGSATVLVGAEMTMLNGQAQATLVNLKAESITLSLNSAGAINDSETAIVKINPGPISLVDMNDLPDATTSDTLILTVRTVDANGNTVPENRTVVLSLTGSASGAGNVELLNGEGAATIQNEVAETITVSLTSGDALPTAEPQTVTFSAGK